MNELSLLGTIPTAINTMQVLTDSQVVLDEERISRSTDNGDVETVEEETSDVIHTNLVHLPTHHLSNLT